MAQEIAYYVGKAVGYLLMGGFVVFAIRCARRANKARQ